MEAIAVVTLSALLMSPVVSLLRSSHSLWEATDGDASRRHAVDSTIHFLAREIHNCEAVTRISDPSQPGALQVRMADESLWTWTYDPTTKEVRFRRGEAPDELLSRGITALQFTGYADGGERAWNAVDDIKSIECAVRSELTNGADYEVKRWVWIRTTADVNGG